MIKNILEKKSDLINKIKFKSLRNNFFIKLNYAKSVNRYISVSLDLISVLLVALTSLFAILSVSINYTSNTELNGRCISFSY